MTTRRGIITHSPLCWNPWGYSMVTARERVDLERRVDKRRRTLPDRLSALIALGIDDALTLDHAVYSPFWGVYHEGRRREYYSGVYAPARFNLAGAILIRKFKVPRRLHFAPWALADDDRRLQDKLCAVAFAERGEIYRALWVMGVGARSKDDPATVARERASVCLSAEQIAAIEALEGVDARYDGWEEFMPHCERMRRVSEALARVWL